MNIIYKGADLAGVQMYLTDDNDDAKDLTGFSLVVLTLTDVYDNVKARYKKPFAQEMGYRALRSPAAGTLEFDIHKEDSANFKVGALYANIYFTAPNTNYPDGYEPEMRKIKIGDVCV